MVKKTKMKKKKEYIEEVAFLRNQNAALQEELNKELEERWNRKIPNATYEAHTKLSMIFKNLLFNLVFEHVDSSGYWFSFELVNDSRRQSYCVRHDELIER